MTPDEAIALLIVEAAVLGYTYLKGYQHGSGKKKEKEKKDKKE
jgi:hypothetical protein